MEREFEKKYHQIEETQWWCRSRREMVCYLVKAYAVSPEAKVLEIGCAGGMLLRDLATAGYTSVRGIDVSESAISAAAQRGIHSVEVMDGCKLHYSDQSFDVIIASDVLEHIEDAATALGEWRRLLRPAGKLILFVPALPILWSHHDVVNQHRRRYSARDLQTVLTKAGFHLNRLSHWNVVLVLPALTLALIRRVFRIRLASQGSGGLSQPWHWINQALYSLISIENVALRKANSPLGVSLFAVAAPNA